MQRSVVGLFEDYSKQESEPFSSSVLRLISVAGHMVTQLAFEAYDRTSFEILIA